MRYSTYSRNTENQNTDLSLSQFTAAEVCWDDYRPTDLQFHWHQFSSAGSKRGKGELPVLKPHTAEYVLSAVSNIDTPNVSG